MLVGAGMVVVFVTGSEFLTIGANIVFPFTGGETVLLGLFRGAAFAGMVDAFEVSDVQPESIIDRRVIPVQTIFNLLFIVPQC